MPARAEVQTGRRKMQRPGAVAARRSPLGREVSAARPHRETVWGLLHSNRHYPVEARAGNASWQRLTSCHASS